MRVSRVSSSTLWADGLYKLMIDDLLKLKGDQYSPNLRNWLKTQRRRYPAFAKRLSVFQNKEGMRYIGFRCDDGEVIGSRLNGVLCQGGREKTGCWVGSESWKELKTFLRRYAKDGVCFTDLFHNSYPQRWDNVNATLRVCKWCARAERLIERPKTIIEKTWEVVVES